MDITRKWLAVVAAVVASSACGSTTTTPTTVPTVFTANGDSNAAISIPDTVMQLQVTGVFTGPLTTFIVWIGPLSVPCPGIASNGCRQLVNQQLGTSTNQLTFSAVVPTGSAGSSANDTLTIVTSAGINWSVDQVQ